MTIAFDTEGLEREGAGRWIHRRTGDVVTFQRVDTVPDLPAGLDDIDRLCHGLAIARGRIGCLLYADVVSLGNTEALTELIKLGQETRGIVVHASLTVPRATSSATITLRAPEGRQTGVREAMVLAEGFFEGLDPDNFRLPTPYAPESECAVPYLVSDNEKYDEKFPGHPLSRARAFLNRLALTAFVDPAFADLPEFRPVPLPYRSRHDRWKR